MNSIAAVVKELFLEQYQDVSTMRRGQLDRLRGAPRSERRSLSNDMIKKLQEYAEKRKRSSTDSDVSISNDDL